VHDIVHFVTKKIYGFLIITDVEVERRREKQPQSDTLPLPEMWSEVFSHLTPREVLNCAQVSRFHHESAMDNIVWERITSQEYNLENQIDKINAHKLGKNHWYLIYKSIRLDSWEFLRAGAYKEALMVSGAMTLGSGILSLPVAFFLKTLKMLTFKQYVCFGIFAVSMTMMGYLQNISEKLKPELKAKIPAKSLLRNIKWHESWKFILGVEIIGYSFFMLAYIPYCAYFYMALPERALVLGYYGFPLLSGILSRRGYTKLSKLTGLGLWAAVAFGIYRIFTS
jgi:hypothetical protein